MLREWSNFLFSLYILYTMYIMLGCWVTFIKLFKYLKFTEFLIQTGEDKINVKDFDQNHCKVVVSITKCLFKDIDHQQSILRLLHKCITPIYKYYTAWICRITRYAPDYDSRISLNRVDWLNINFFFDIRNLHCIMLLINFIFIFSSGLEIFSKLNIHHHVKGCHFIDAIYKFDLAQNCYPSQWPVQYVQLTNAI